MEASISDIIHTAQAMGYGCHHRLLGEIDDASSESYSWINAVFKLMFPHLQYDVEWTGRSKMRVYAQWPRTDSVLANVLPKALLSSNIRTERYGKESKIDPRFPLKKEEKSFVCTLYDGNKCTIDTLFYDINSDLLFELEHSRLLGVPSEWNDLWERIWTDAYINRSCSVEPLDW